MRILIWFASACALCAQVEIHLSYGLLQNIVAAQVFSEDGRKYVKGNKQEKCTFAYLENPRIAEAGGKIEVRAKFSGRSALNVLGQCVGVGDSFDATIRMTPYADKATLRLKDIEVSGGPKPGLYARRVCKALAETLPGVLIYDLAPDFKRALEAEQPGVPFRKSVDGVAVRAVRVSKESLILDLAFRLLLR